MSQLIQFVLLQIAIILGLIASFVLPYVRKKFLKGEIDELDPKYIYHLVITALWQFIISFAVYSAWQPPGDIASGTLMLILAFFFGFGGSDIQKEADKALREYFEKKQRDNIQQLDSSISPELVPEAAAMTEDDSEG